MAEHCKIEIDLALDGNAWSVLVGPNLAQGYAGYGDTPIEALRDLCATFERQVGHLPPESMFRYFKGMER